MNCYLIRITMPDGSKGQCYGLYADGFAAVIQTLTDFPAAQRISARRLP